jgi:hypothetical protein
MKSRILYIYLSLLCLLGCTKDIWNTEEDGIPVFVKTNYIELEDIYKISKFRSSEGHDYSDDYESCRSMKHYFVPKSNVDWTKVRIYSPVKGTIKQVTQEWAGTQIEIVPEGYPAFRVVIFHINLLKQCISGYKVDEGEQIGSKCK